MFMSHKQRKQTIHPELNSIVHGYCRDHYQTNEIEQNYIPMGLIHIIS